MREHGTLMNGEMIRAFSDDRKGQTRRPVKPQPAPSFGPPCDEAIPAGDGMWMFGNRAAREALHAQCGQLARSPFGVPGDRLWFRETWAPNLGYSKGIAYRADYHEACEVVVGPANQDGEPAVDVARWHPSIHMPRWAARYTPLVKRVWVERVQDITPEDAVAEGVKVPRCGCDACRMSGGMCTADASVAIEDFARLWDSIYAARGLGWDANPWVWCCEFERCSEARR